MSGAAVSRLAHRQPFAVLIFRPLRRTVASGYSAAVRNLVLHRWAVIFLLVSRLVFGEFAHAMPLAMMSPGEVTHAGAPAVECHEHQGAVAGAQSLDDAHEAHGAGEDCCKNGKCECPCVHLSSAAAESFVMHDAARDPHRMSEPALGVAAQRPSSPFRPPA